MDAEKIAGIFLMCAGAYLGVGVLVALLIEALYLQKMDARTRGASLGFRLLIIPGLAILWPIMLVKALGSGKASGGGEGR